MEKEKAVKDMMLLDVMSNPIVSPESYSFISACLYRMYQIGFEANDLNRSRQREVHRYTMDGKYLDSYPSLVSAGRIFGVNDSSIAKAIKGRNHSAAGYKWKYAVTLTPSFPQSDNNDKPVPDKSTSPEPRKSSFARTP